MLLMRRLLPSLGFVQLRSSEILEPLIGFQEVFQSLAVSNRITPQRTALGFILLSQQPALFLQHSSPLLALTDHLGVVDEIVTLGTLALSVFPESAAPCLHTSCV